MQLDQQVQGTSSGFLSERSNCSDDGLILEALRKMMRNELNMMVIHAVHQVIGPIMEDSVRKLLQGSWVIKELEVMVIRTYHQIIGPIMEDLVRRIMKENFQSAQEKLMASTQRSSDETNVTSERTLQLKFSGEVSEPVLTGKAIEGKCGTLIKIELVDKMTGKVVESGPEASAKVEILVLEASDDDNGNYWTTEDFNNRIIREGDKTKPHISKTKFIYLEAGVGDLSDVKLGQDKNWSKICKCRLGARIVGNFDGTKVEEALTKPFNVSDSRSTLYVKHYPPALSDEVWRLDNIARNGPRCERLKKEDISTVQDFLFLLSVNPERLREIVGMGSSDWKATVAHARTCMIENTQMYMYNSTSVEFEMNVVFDAVGQLKGIIRNAHYIPIDNLSEDDKAGAHKLLRLASKHRKDIVSLGDETSLLQQFPRESSNLDGPHGGNARPTSEQINEFVPQEYHISEHLDHSHPFGLHVSENSGLLHDHSLTAPGYFPGPSSPLYEFSPFLENFSDNQILMSLSSNSSPLIIWNESDTDHQSNASSIHLVGPAAAKALFSWLSRVRKMRAKGKRALDIGDANVHKKQRFSEEDRP